jgi:glutathione S-transferase
VRLALAELGAEYETIEVNLFKGEHRKPEFAAINPHRKVPVLEDDGERIFESNAILVYLGKTRGKWPTRPADEARALRWMFFESMHMAMQCGTIWWADVIKPAIGRGGAEPPVVQEAVEELERSLALLDEHFRDRPFLMGDDLTLADCSVGVALAALRTTRLDTDRFPNVLAYRERLRARPSWAAAHGDAIHRID